MDRSLLDVGVQISVLLLPLLVGYLTGTIAEHTHYRSIRTRELRHRRMPTTTLKRPPPHWKVIETGLVTGGTVVSIDYFKRFLAGLRGLVGGRISAYESLLDRARREAVLRAKEEALAGGYHAIVNLRLESARIANSRRNGKGTAGVEVLAFGTALKLAP